MKTLRKFLAAFLAMLMCIGAMSVAASAEGAAQAGSTAGQMYEGDRIQSPTNADGDYTFTVVDGTAKITGFNKSHIGDVVIPETLGGYTVTVIGAGAFEECNRISSITIPDCVKTIEDRAFYNCIRAKKLTIGKGVASIGVDAFSRLLCLQELYFNAERCQCGQSTPFKQLGVSGDGVTVYFGDSACTVPAFLFGYNDGELKIDTSMMTVDIFGKDVNLSDLLTSSLKFDVQTLNIVRVVIGKNVTAIGRYAFAFCSKISSVYFTDSITSMGENAFACGTTFTKEYESQNSFAYRTMENYNTTGTPPISTSNSWAVLLLAPLLGVGVSLAYAVMIFLIPISPVIKLIDYLQFAFEYVFI